MYIGRQEYFTQIDEKLEAGIGEPMVLLGESGMYIMSHKLIMGKSGIHIVILEWGESHILIDMESDILGKSHTLIPSDILVTGQVP